MLKSSNDGFWNRDGKQGIRVILFSPSVVEKVWCCQMTPFGSLKPQVYKKTTGMLKFKNG